jgi:antitoxin CcdA
MRMNTVMPTSKATVPKRSLPARQPLKRAINLSLSTDVLDAAKALELNVSQVCDTYLREFVAQEERRRWRIDHVDFIAAYNATIDTEGLPLDPWRTF